MGGITSGVGLFSGIDTRSLINQLLQIEARPKQLAQSRIAQLQKQQAAYLGVNSAILALKTAAGSFDTKKIFDANKATSSDGAVLSATAGSTASPGTYNFTVNRLVTTQQVLSRGFTSRDSAAVGATSFTFETGGGGLSSETTLSELNGGAGISRGKIVITETGGGTTTVDLSTAVTVNDVLDRINEAAGVDVTAAVDGDKIKLTQGAGLTFSISSAAGFDTASDLGIQGTSTGATLTGSRVRTISGNTALTSLNDGAGVMIRDGAADLVITDRAGLVLNVDLGEITQTVADVTTVVQSRATTLQSVVDIINAKADAAGSEVTASIDTTNNRLVITDATASPTGNLIIVDGANARKTATDLGIATGSGGVASGTINGKKLIAGLNSTLVSSLAGGVGVSATEITVTDKAGISATINVSAAALDGSVDDVIANINSQLTSGGVGAKVSLNRAGNGLSIKDTTSGSGTFTVSGAGAEALGIDTAATANASVNGENLQSRWIGLSTKLSTLNAGKGIGTGEFRVTNSTGATKLFKVTSSQKTVDDFIQFINAQGLTGVSAQINAQGDGIELVDTSGGSNKLIVKDSSGTVAKSLNLVGEYAVESGTARADGSYEREVKLDATDSLDKVVSKIRSAGIGVSAAVINDGSPSSPFRLSLTSTVSGRIGRVIVDSGNVDLALDTLSKGDDSVVFFGSTDPARAVLLTGSTNVLDNVVQGVTIDLNQTSNENIEVVVTRDNDTIEKSVEDFVKAYNGVLEAIDRYDTYDADSNTRGVLLGDSTAGNIRQGLLRAVQSRPKGVNGQFEFLFQVGVKIGTGAKLEFDRDKFRAAMETSAADVKALFSARQLIPNEPREIFPGVTVADTEDDFSSLGVAEQIRKLADDLSNGVDGVITQRNKSLDTQIKLQNDRVGNIDLKLASKRTRLERQFLAMEQAIASLQSQSSALSGLGSAG